MDIVILILLAAPWLSNRLAVLDRSFKTSRPRSRGGPLAHVETPLSPPHHAVFGHFGAGLVRMNSRAGLNALVDLPCHSTLVQDDDRELARLFCWHMAATGGWPCCIHPHHPRHVVSSQLYDPLPAPYEGRTR